MPMSTKYTACQLCDHTKARDGKTVPLAVIVIANVRLCKRHQTILATIAAQDGVSLASYVGAHSAERRRSA
jgi:hypothetical protein